MTSNVIYLQRWLATNRAMRAWKERLAPGKRCAACGQWKTLNEFHSQPSGKFGRHSYCAECACAKQRECRVRNYEPEKSRRWQLKTRYGISPTDYDRIFAKQNGRCAICGDIPERPCVDHDHRTGLTRGILCHGCNIKLPAVEDSSYRANALAYLTKYSQSTTDSIRFLSVCSGIEAASCAWPEWQAVAFAEIEKFPSAVLAHHYPDVPNLGDFTKIDTASLGRVDILCGGTPCQAFSVAGARKGLNDARGNLTLAFVELAHELADGNGLRNVIWENVPGIFSDRTNAFGCFLAGLVGAAEPIVPNGKWTSHGMVAGPKARAAWAVKDAQFFGLAQRRKRVIVVADFRNGADPAAVLFEPEGVRRDSPPSRETGEGVAAAISARTKGCGGLGTDFDLDGGLRVVSRPLLAKGNDSFDETLQTYIPTIARCDTTREGSSQDYESTTMVAVVHGTQDPCTGEHTAFALGRNHGGENVIAFSAKDYGADASTDLAPTLRAGGHTSSHANAGVMPAIAFQCSQSGVRTSDVHATLDSNNGPRRHNGALYGSAVRRLTPRECERLQGFPDDYTAIPWRGKPPEDCPDGPRYKALGNSWAVPLFAWLGERIQRFIPPR